VKHLYFARITFSRFEYNRNIKHTHIFEITHHHKEMNCLIKSTGRSAKLKRSKFFLRKEIAKLKSSKIYIYNILKGVGFGVVCPVSGMQLRQFLLALSMYFKQHTGSVPHGLDPSYNGPMDYICQVYPNSAKKQCFSTYLKGLQWL